MEAFVVLPPSFFWHILRRSGTLSLASRVSMYGSLHGKQAISHLGTQSQLPSD